MPSVQDFPDKLEGTAPQGEVDWWEKNIGLAGTEQQRDVIKSNWRKIRGFAAMFRPHYYASCWHMNEAENPRMWQEYTQGAPSVAIGSSYQKLRRELPEYAYLGVVRYIDYAADRLPTLNMFEYVMHKNAGPFEFEREVRALVLPPVEVDRARYDDFMKHFFERDDGSGRRVFAPLVNLQCLVDRVVLHPQSTDEHVQRAKDKCAAHGLPEPSRSVAVRPM